MDRHDRASTTGATPTGPEEKGEASGGRHGRPSGKGRPEGPYPTQAKSLFTKGWFWKRDSPLMVYQPFEVPGTFRIEEKQKET